MRTLSLNNMKYFTKYLPVEGEIKEGDYILNLLYNHIKKVIEIHKEGKDFNDFIVTTDNTGCYRDKAKKVRLFLCSRDIQVGDEFNIEVHGQFRGTYICIDIKDELFYYNGGKEYGICSVGERFIYKIIGEVSKYATWMTERDVDESELEFWGEHNDGDKWMTEEWGNLVIFNPNNPTVKIKGPCGHYH